MTGSAATGPLLPGLDPAAFAAALADFRVAVGAQWVFTSEADRASYLDPFAIGDPQAHAAAAAVAPATTDELALVLAAANRHGVPVWPVSMGKNLAYGTAAPALRGSVVLDLKRMNRILEINEELGYALVEPGVSYFDFKAELDRRGSRLWMSGAAHSWGSVMGNALEHGVGYTPYGIHAETICGMEVMLADGSLVRTGLGAIAGSREWQVFKWPFGPNWDGLFTQSNFAVVTKMGIWLMPEPEAMAGFTISVPAKGDLAQLVDTLRPLRLDDTINATYTIANAWRQSTAGMQRAELWQGAGAIPEEVVARHLASRGRGWWNVIFNVFDHVPGGIDLRIAKIRQHFAAHMPQATITHTSWKKGEPQQPWMRQEVSLAPFAIVDWRGSPGGHSDFGPVVAAVGERVTQVYDLIERRFIEHGLDPWVGMFGMGGRALIFVADMLYKRDDPEMTAACQRLFRTLCREVAEMGVGLYRAHITFMDDAAAMHTWGAAQDTSGGGAGALPRLNDRVKALLDPGHILAPGKQGIGSRRP
ncbi:FAD-binding oxidoreductase [Alteraurantiacibacter palmitatis]|uniref:FAD-dependent oxidoreductase n=1 Tax=Alteraurantiacibacter palmitatis TaxID=2054628 RepID=A0ABV7EBT6_9SPHN